MTNSPATQDDPSLLLPPLITCSGAHLSLHTLKHQHQWKISCLPMGTPYLEGSGVPDIGKTHKHIADSSKQSIRLRLVCLIMLCFIGNLHVNRIQCHVAFHCLHCCLLLGIIEAIDGHQRHNCKSLHCQARTLICTFGIEGKNKRTAPADRPGRAPNVLKATQQCPIVDTEVDMACTCT